MIHQKKSRARLVSARGPETKSKLQTQFTRKKLPFSSSLSSHVASNSIRLFFGGSDAWDRARDDLQKGRPALCLPVSESLASFQWEALRGLSIVAVEVCDTGAEFRRALVCVLAAAGVREVFLIPSSMSPGDSVSWGVAS